MGDDKRMKAVNPLFYQTRKILPIVSKAHGIYIWDQDGKEYIDACSGAVICNIGYGNAAVLEAVNKQAESTFFVYRTQFENQPAMDLARSLVKYSASHLNRVFYVSGGSEAVEAAMKVCRHYFYQRGETSRYQFISRTPSYHGSTLGALALTSYAPLEIPFRPLIQSYPKIPAPYCFRCAYHKTYPDCGLECAWALEKVIREQGPENVAAFVAEPIGGASTGALVPPGEYFDIIQQICRRYGILLILDEVMTGFGRTGKMFAYEHWGIEADIVALSKGMASGYFPLGAVMARESIVEEVVRKDGFPHGHTYAGNPMACCVGLAVLNQIVNNGLCENAAEQGTVLKNELQALACLHPFIGQVRGKGLLLALEFVKDPETREPFAPELQVHSLVTEIAFREGLVIYPRRSINGLTGDHVLIAPPLTVTAGEVDEIVARLDRALHQVSLTLAA
jgi:adenosylmethionine-8-amino-7-oxononanoate aminotransferase